MDNSLPDIKARSLTIVDSAGRDRIRLFIEADNQPNITLLDIHGAPRVHVFLGGDCKDADGIVACVDVGDWDEAGSGAVSLFACRDGSTVNVGGSQVVKARLNHDMAEGPTLLLGERRFKPADLAPLGGTEEEPDHVSLGGRAPTEEEFKAVLDGALGLSPECRRRLLDRLKAHLGQSPDLAS